METVYFWAEILLLVVLPLALLSQSKVRNNPQFLYWTCAIVVMGFMANRLNVSITAVDAMTGANYVPKWPEFALTMAVLIIAAPNRMIVVKSDQGEWPALYRLLCGLFMG